MLSTRENGNDIIYGFILRGSKVLLYGKKLILWICTYGHRGEKLRSHSNNYTLIPERIIMGCCVVPSLHLDLVSASHASDSAGGKHTSNKRESNLVEGKDDVLVGEDSDLTAMIDNVVRVSYLLSWRQVRRVGAWNSCVEKIRTTQGRWGRISERTGGTMCFLPDFTGDKGSLTWSVVLIEFLKILWALSTFSDFFCPCPA